MEGVGYISLFELQSRIGSVLEAALPQSVWVCAEIAEIKVNYSGHCYLELIEKQSNGNAGAVAKAQARAVIWKSLYATLAPRFERASGRQLMMGMKILVRASVGYHPVYGLSLQISDIDPTYTLGEMERQRQQTIDRLKEEGVWDMNRNLPMPTVPQRIAVVSSGSAAGYRDFCREIESSPYRISLTLFEAVMQGNASEQSVVAALGRIAERAEEFDATVIIRGGGSTGDLDAFNAYLICSYVAQFPLPVLTGIGHDKDISVADLVAAKPLKTPTAVAAWLAGRAEAFDADLEYMAVQLRELCAQTTHSAELRLQRISADIRNTAQMAVATEQKHLQHLDQMVRSASGMALQRESRRIENYEALIENFAPERLFQLGFALAKIEGRAIRSVEQVERGDRIEITLSDGSITAEILDKELRRYGKEE